ncbi:MAG TPA: ATP-binding protein [Vicinamibacteria bacterium]|jgi:PAS domain S-box-containing protein
MAGASPITPARAAAAGGPGGSELLEAKLGLAEFLVASDNPKETAYRSLEWLAEYGELRRGVCLTFDAESGRLGGLAAVGVDPAAVERFTIEPDDHGSRILSLALGRQTDHFDDTRAGSPATPLGRGRYLAVPLSGRIGRETVPTGLLLLGPPTDVLREMAGWLGGILGHRLARLARLRQALESDRRLRRERMLIDTVPDPIILTDTEGAMLVANTAAHRLFGSVEGESEGRRRAVALNNMLFSSAVPQGGWRSDAQSRELLLVDPQEGSDLLFEIITRSVADAREGTAQVAVLRNVSDLHRATEQIEENYRRVRVAEAEARAERDRLDLIINSVADPIVVSDPGGAIVMMNDPAERIFSVPEGASPETALRVRANDAHFSSFVSNLLFGEGTTRHHGGVSLVDPPSGQALPVEAVSGKVLAEHGELAAIVTVLHDRSEQVEKERLYEELKLATEQLEQRITQATVELAEQNEQLRRSKLELEAASAAKSQFLANMSHEFRTPLNAILGYTSMMLQGITGPVSPALEKNLRRVDSNGRHLLALINDVLDISRIEAGRMPVTLSDFELPGLIREVLAELEPIITRSRLSVRSELPRRMPALTSDRPKVKQIVLNLVNNAIKFTPSGSVVVSTSFDARRKETAVSVTDTGIGIDPEDQERIFEDFRQADNSPAREYGGAGLGLAICRRLADILDGRLELRSRPGQGSTFSLVLPRKPRRR